MIYYEIINPIVKTKNDPGITLWCGCCIRFGQRGKFSKNKKKRKEEGLLEREKRYTKTKKEFLKSLKFEHKSGQLIDAGSEIEKLKITFL